MTAAAPGPERYASPRRFESAPQSLAIYIVRDRWADTRHLVVTEIDGRAVQTLPIPFVRAQMPPGRLALRMSFAGNTNAFDVDRRAGRLGVAELAGSV